MAADTIYHAMMVSSCHVINSSPPGQNDHHFADDIFQCIFMNDKIDKID